MTASSIQHTRNGRNYRTPVLLDQHSLVRIGLAMVLFLAIIFMSGYVIGFQKAELKLAAPITQLVLALPERVAVVTEEIGPKIPQLIEPGENIDVDSADETGTAQLAGVPATRSHAKPADLISHNKKKIIAEAGLMALSNDVKALTTVPMGMGGPAASDPGQVDEGMNTALYGNATRESARYSIQVGMFSQLDNAERKVKELMSAELNAYFDEYLNGDNESRYNVRFGYFTDHRSARESLEAYQQERAGSGYIVNLQTTAP